MHDETFEKLINAGMIPPTWKSFTLNELDGVYFTSLQELPEFANYKGVRAKLEKLESPPVGR